MTKRPSEEHVRAVLLSEDDPQPQMIWQHERMSLGPNSSWKPLVVDLDYNKYLKTSKRKLTSTVMLCYDDNFACNDAKLNSTIEVIDGLHKGCYPSFQWRGPMVLRGVVGLDDDDDDDDSEEARSDRTGFCDIEMDYFHHRID
jgi:hypothetical protein